MLLHDWVIINVTYRYTGKYAVVLDMSRLGFAPPTMERYTLGTLGIMVSSISGLGIMTKELVTGVLEHGNKKRVQTSNEDN
jgi:hypothetical protein